MEPYKFTGIKENIEHKENEEYYTVIRRKKESNSKKIPWYFFIIVIFFMYDDVPLPEENPILFKISAFILIFCGIPFAFGQGQVVTHLFNTLSERIGATTNNLLTKFKTN